MEKSDQWNRRAGGTISVFYLLIFTVFEVYSAMATALDSSLRFPRWESYLGWALLILPATLLASLFLLHGRRPKLGFSIIIANLCLYASFIIFESIASVGAPVSHQAEWEFWGICAMLFLVAVLAARFLETKTQARDS
jgi:hypothetical protein